MMPAHSALGLALGSEVKWPRAWAGGIRTLDLADSPSPPLPVHSHCPAHLSCLPPPPLSEARGPTAASRVGEVRGCCGGAQAARNHAPVRACCSDHVGGTDAGTQGAGGSGTYLWGARGR